MKKQPEKLFIIRKYVFASSAKQAILKDRRTPVDDVWIDEEWKKKATEQLTPAIGFGFSAQDGD